MIDYYLQWNNEVLSISNERIQKFYKHFQNKNLPNSIKLPSQSKLTKLLDNKQARNIKLMKKMQTNIENIQLTTIEQLDGVNDFETDNSEESDGSVKYYLKIPQDDGKNDLSVSSSNENVHNESDDNDEEDDLSVSSSNENVHNVGSISYSESILPKKPKEYLLNKKTS